jgi:predicted enzyme related to lactoylglutathione lyase
MSGPQELAEFGGLRYAFLKDPEGNIVELMERDPPR